MVNFPNCKINLGLHVTAKRSDGFHNIETVFWPVNICDALEIIAAPAIPDVMFTSAGLAVAGKEEDNICCKAFHLLKKDFPQLPGIKMHLYKAIPMGAGLGGGSADGAFTLLLLNKKFQLNLNEKQLLHYSLQLGSDCPFFILNKPSFARGRGEMLEIIDLNLAGYTLLIINPGVHINTGWAFSQIMPAMPPKSIQTIIQQPIQTWKAELVNDFEQTVLQHYPQLGAIKENLYNTGAVYAGMSGSGSTFFGIYPSNAKIDSTVFTRTWFVKEVYC